MDDDLSCPKFGTRFSYALLSPELMIFPEYTPFSPQYMNIILKKV